MSKKIAVVLSGCGYLDGAEIRESVITLLELDKQNAQVGIFAPDLDQHHVVNHINGEETSETRNVLVEAARIARGDIKNLTDLNPTEFDALILPGGFGVAKNLSNVAFGKGDVNHQLGQFIHDFHSAGKPIGAICISPAVIAASLKDTKQVTMTLGQTNPLLESFGAKEEICTASQISVDNDNKIVSTPAYMCEERISNISSGISKLVEKVLELA